MKEHRPSINERVSFARMKLLTILDKETYIGGKEEEELKANILWSYFIAAHLLLNNRKEWRDEKNCSG